MADLSLKKMAIAGLWSVRSTANQDLNSFSNVVFSQEINIGEMITVDALRLIRVWPQAAYLLSGEEILPGSVSGFETMVTDIAHGFCQLSIAGDEAVAFLNDYSYADINQKKIMSGRTIRTALGHYQTLMWWDDPTDIRILVDRSYAQSFGDYLHHLLQRWCGDDFRQGEPTPMLNSGNQQQKTNDNQSK